MNKLILTVYNATINNIYDQLSLVLLPCMTETTALILESPKPEPKSIKKYKTN